MLPAMPYLRPTDPPAGDLFKPPVFLGSLMLSGFAPVMRGTSGTILAVIPAFFLLGQPMPEQLGLWLGFALAYSILSLIVGTAVLRAYPTIKDPGWFVLDEGAGVYTTLALFQAGSPLDICFAFLTFRLYDICKPWPVRAFERFPRAWGILADDLVAGVMAGLTCWGLRWVWQLL